MTKPMMKPMTKPMTMLMSKPLSMARVLPLVACGVLAASSAQARPNYVDHIPNGTEIDGTGCINCHTTTQGGGNRNAFGQDIGSSTDWASVCGNDSDGDGATNGEELGDADCIWTAGATPASSTVTNPGEGAGCSSTGASTTGILAALSALLLFRRRH